MHNLHIIGINHKSAKLELREQVMFVPNLISRAYQDIQKCNVSEVVLISTCARTECIVVTENINEVTQWFANFHNLPLTLLENNIMHYSGENAVKHLMRVAAGIDSFVLGETQILGQMKKAFAIAEDHSTVGPLFYKLFATVFSVAKQIRTKTNISSKNVSLAAALTNAAKDIFGTLAGRRVMLIGAGDMINLVTSHLYSNGIRSWVMANRTLEKAQEIANSFAGNAIVIEEIPKYLSNVDIVISATASPVAILGKGLTERVQAQRGHIPLLMADLAMPRDIEPEVNQVAGVCLYHLDDLQKMIQINLQGRTNAVVSANPMITQACERFIKEHNSRAQIQVIRDFRNSVENVKLETLNNACAKIDLGLDPKEVISQALNKFTQKIIHTPTVKLRTAAKDHNHDILQCAGFIFDLKHDKEVSSER